MKNVSGEHRTNFGKKFNMKPISMSTKRKMVAEVGVTALYIYEYYVQYISVQQDEQISDDRTAKALGLSKRVVERNRIKLTNANYFYLTKTSNKRDSHYHYALGREAVMRVKYYDSLFGCGTAYKVRRKFSPGDVLDALNKSDVDPLSGMDIFDTIRPSTSEEKKYASKEWLEYEL